MTPPTHKAPPKYLLKLNNVHRIDIVRRPANAEPTLALFKSADGDMVDRDGSLVPVVEDAATMTQLLSGYIEKAVSKAMSVSRDGRRIAMQTMPMLLRDLDKMCGFMDMADSADQGSLDPVIAGEMMNVSRLLMQLAESFGGMTREAPDIEELPDTLAEVAKAGAAMSARRMKMLEDVFQSVLKLMADARQMKMEDIMGEMYKRMHGDKDKMKKGEGEHPIASSEEVAELKKCVADLSTTVAEMKGLIEGVTKSHEALDGRFAKLTKSIHSQVIKAMDDARAPQTNDVPPGDDVRKSEDTTMVIRKGTMTAVRSIPFPETSS